MKEYALIETAPGEEWRVKRILRGNYLGTIEVLNTLGQGLIVEVVTKEVSNEELYSRIGEEPGVVSVRKLKRLDYTPKLYKEIITN